MSSSWLTNASASLAEYAQSKTKGDVEAPNESVGIPTSVTRLFNNSINFNFFKSG